MKKRTLTITLGVLLIFSMFYITINSESNNQITGYQFFPFLQTQTAQVQRDIIGEETTERLTLARTALEGIEFPEIFCQENIDCVDINPVEVNGKYRQWYCNREGLCGIREYPVETPEIIRPPCLNDQDCGFHEACISVDSDSILSGGKCARVECNNLIPCLDRHVCMNYECKKICEDDETGDCISEDELMGSIIFYDLEKTFQVMSHQYMMSEKMLNYYQAVKDNNLKVSIFEFTKEKLNRAIIQTIDVTHIDPIMTQQMTPGTFFPLTVASSISGDFLKDITGFFYRPDLAGDSAIFGTGETPETIQQETKVTEHKALFDEAFERVMEAHENLLNSFIQRLNLFDLKVQFLQNQICKLNENFENLDLGGIDCESHIKKHFDDNIQPYAIYYRDLNDERMKLGGFININRLNEMIELPFFDKSNLKFGSLNEHNQVFFLFDINEKDIRSVWRLNEDREVYHRGHVTSEGQRIREKTMILTDLNHPFRKLYAESDDENKALTIYYNDDYLSEEAEIVISIQNQNLKEFHQELPNLANTLYIKSDMEVLLILENNKKVRTKEIWLSKELPLNLEIEKIGPPSFDHIPTPGVIESVTQPAIQFPILFQQ